MPLKVRSLKDQAAQAVAKSIKKKVKSDYSKSVNAPQTPKLKTLRVTPKRFNKIQGQKRAARILTEHRADQLPIPSELQRKIKKNYNEAGGVKQTSKE